MSGAECVGRPLDAQRPEGRWGLRSRITGRWLAVGSEARWRAVAAHRAEVDAHRARTAPRPLTG